MREFQFEPEDGENNQIQVLILNAEYLLSTPLYQFGLMAERSSMQTPRNR